MPRVRARHRAFVLRCWWWQRRLAALRSYPAMREPLRLASEREAPGLVVRWGHRYRPTDVADVLAEQQHHLAVGSDVWVFETVFPFIDAWLHHVADPNRCTAVARCVEIDHGLERQVHVQHHEGLAVLGRREVGPVLGGTLVRRK